MFVDASPVTWMEMFPAPVVAAEIAPSANGESACCPKYTTDPRVTVPMPLQLALKKPL
jgi:hypothetical protein